MQVQPYLFFNGRCEEAAAFYTRAIGAEVTALMRTKDAPEPPPPGQVPPGWDDKVLHMNLRIGDTMMMASDGCATEKATFKGFSLSLNASSDAEAERMFAALSEGGEVQMPLGPTFFASRFGMLVDRFGVGWMVIKALDGAAKP